MKEINIGWSGPYTYEEIINKKEDKFGGDSVKPKDKGLYQIYGSHPIYGDNVLIYIGKTIQPFYKRLKERGVILNNHDAKNVQIYLGAIHYDNSEKSENIEDDIIDAESLLIHYHKPSHNSSSINSFNTKSKDDFSIYNYGYFRQLIPSISTKFYEEYKIYSKIQEIAKKLDINDIYDEEDGYGFDLTDKIWFGIEYSLWSNETVFVIMSTENIFDNKKIKKYDEDDIWFYEEIYGNEEEIKIQLEQYYDKNRHK